MSKEPDVKMTYQNFVQRTVSKMNEIPFSQLKEALVDKFISFSIISAKEIDQTIMAEKLCDYFEKAEIKNRKPFEKFVEEYFKHLDSIVAGRVAKAPQPVKKGDAVLPVPRARKYYEKAQEQRKYKLNFSVLLDYTRIMMCLYAAIIDAKGKEINNLDFAASSLKVDKIICSMQEETDTSPLNLAKKKKFDTKDLYCDDSITFIITIIMLYKILDYSLEEGNKDD